MDLAEKERVRLERHRLYQKRYRQKQAVRANKPHPVPVHMPWEMRERLDYLVMVHKPPGGASELMRRAFEFYAAHLLEVAPPTEAAAEPGPEPLPEKPEPEPLPPPAEPAVGVAGRELEIPTVEAEPPLPSRPERAVVSMDELIRETVGRSAAVAKKPRARRRQQKIEKTLVDADKRVPVRIEFTRKHHHLPWGLRNIMWDNGLKHRGNVWRGRLMPDYAEVLRQQVARYDGALEVTGGLGDAPKWAPGEYGGGGSRKKKTETA